MPTEGPSDCTTECTHLTVQYMPLGSFVAHLYVPDVTRTVLLVLSTSLAYHVAIYGPQRRIVEPSVAPKPHIAKDTRGGMIRVCTH